MDPKQRLANFEKMAAADPDNELAHFSLGKAHFEMGTFADAETSLRRTLELNPDHSLSYRFLGEALLKQGRREEAVEILERGVEVANRRGELMPLNAMRDILQAEGVTVSVAAPNEESAADRGAPESGDFVCKRCARAGMPLNAPPFKSDLGHRIHASICTACWKEWIGVSVKLINELRLNLMAEKDSQLYDQHMSEFLGV